jgi:hypothetical protein
VLRPKLSVTNDTEPNLYFRFSTIDLPLSTRSRLHLQIKYLDLVKKMATRTKVKAYSSNKPIRDKVKIVESAPVLKAARSTANHSSATEAATPDSSEPNYGDQRYVRRNIEELSIEEFWRYARAIEAMKEGAAKRANTDWWNICSIHGGGFSPEVRNQIKPLMEAYVRDYSSINGDNPTKVDEDWLDMGFCAHGNSTFLIWHRVYMKCFELCLQHYDPWCQHSATDAEKAAVRGNPLMAHYWQWDSPDSKAIPYRINAEVLKDEKGILRRNPLFQGVSNEPDARGFTVRAISGARQYDPKMHDGEYSPYQGLNPADLNSAYEAFTLEDDYSVVCTQNNYGNSRTYEEAHGMLHNCVGGWFDGTAPDGNGDLTDVPYSSFDPLFWLHHSNVERMHYSWLAWHDVPTELKYWVKDADGKTDKDRVRNITDLPLWPFPEKGNLSYDNLPWKRGGPTLRPSMAADWWDNASVDYHYEDATHVGAPMPTPKFNAKTHAKVHVVLHNMYVRGSGLLSPKIKIGTHEVTLPPRAIFFAPESALCPACDQRRLTLGWDIIVPKSALFKKVVSAVRSRGKASAGGEAAVAVAVSDDEEAFVKVTGLGINRRPLDHSIVNATWQLA